ncbi:MAG: hydrogenase maturation protease [Bacteroidales bacterium]
MISETEILVLGIGNLLLKDEGIGIHAVNYLKNKELPDFVTLLDGGTGGFHLLELFQKYKTIIIIDATLDNNSPGTVRVIQPKYSTDYPKSLSAHDIGLKDLVESAILLGNSPKVYLIVISVSDFQDLGIEISHPLDQVFEEIYHKTIDLINS